MSNTSLKERELRLELKIIKHMEFDLSALHIVHWVFDIELAFANTSKSIVLACKSLTPCKHKDPDH